MGCWMWIRGCVVSWIDKKSPLDLPVSIHCDPVRRTQSSTGGRNTVTSRSATTKKRYPCKGWEIASTIHLSDDSKIYNVDVARTTNREKVIRMCIMTTMKLNEDDVLRDHILCRGMRWLVIYVSGDLLVAICGDPTELSHPNTRRRTNITCTPGYTRASKGGNNASTIDFSNSVIIIITDIYIATNKQTM